MKSLSRAAVIAAVRKTSLTVAAVGNGVVLQAKMGTVPKLRS